METINNVKRFNYESGSDYSKGILGHDDIIKMVPQMIKDRLLLASIVGQKYPFCFVDESQDTFPDVVDALRAVARQMAGRFCLGFFGDPMQQIYVSGVGKIAPDENWREITKPENFRCPAMVLSVINNIRSQGDGLKQTRGRQQLVDNVWQSVQGSAELFVLPADEHRARTLDRIRAWLAERHSDTLWANDSKEADVRILVIVHRMAATRLGFPDLFAAFNDNAPESFSTSFREGNAWALKPFLDVFLPLSLAVEQNHQSEVMTLLRTHCPRLTKDNLRGTENYAELLLSLKENVRELAGLMSKTSNASVLDVLKFAQRVHLMIIDERFSEYVDPVLAENPEGRAQLPVTKQEGEDSDGDKTVTALAAYLACPANQIWGYHTYISDESPYSTQQGVKGAEFERVIVVLDDEEGRHPQFSYDKLLGLKEPSQTDTDNMNQHKETVLDRTRRLFYVCCSRARKSLAVVLYSHDVDQTIALLEASGLFQRSDIHTLDHLP